MHLEKKKSFKILLYDTFNNWFKQRYHNTLMRLASFSVLDSTHSHHRVWSADSAEPSAGPPPAAAAHWPAPESVCRLTTEDRKEGLQPRRSHPTPCWSHKDGWWNLFSVSSSFWLLWASSSWACSAAIFSRSHSSCCTLSILFSCCTLMNLSLCDHTHDVSVHTAHKEESHLTQSEAVLPVLNRY